MQLTIGLSGAICPPVLFLFFRPTSGRDNRNNLSDSKVPLGCGDRKSFYVILRILQITAAVLALSLILLGRTEMASLSVRFLALIALYGASSCMCLCLLRLLVMSFVRARAVCLVWSCVECAQAIPVFIGPTLAG